MTEQTAKQPKAQKLVGVKGMNDILPPDSAVWNWFEATARRVRATVMERTGYALSIGGGSNRMIAKLAAERAKPSKAPDAEGVRIVADGTELAFMATLALAEIPGIGPKRRARLLQRFGGVRGGHAREKNQRCIGGEFHESEDLRKLLPPLRGKVGMGGQQAPLHPHPVLPPSRGKERTRACSH